MDTGLRYVDDLGSWDLPRAEELESRLLEELTTNMRVRLLRPEILGEELYAVLFARLREIAAVVVNETISYWVKGLADGNDGASPELCVEFPYLQHESVEPLVVDYCVDNQDGTRTRLHRIDLSTALTDCVDRMEYRGREVSKITKAMATELRALAQQLEAQGVLLLEQQQFGDDGPSTVWQQFAIVAKR